ncbi:MAG: DUF3726 domain-containing protein [Woeseiaceae bacterium]|nr:DUF3726 domain-containing protein [Woeseiaceae bacterium]
MSSINMSMNELSALLKRSFEGLGYCHAEYEDAAASVLWLEAHGLPGFETVARAWPRLSAGTGTEIQITNRNEPATIVDGGGASLFTAGRALAEFAVGARPVDDARLECRHVCDRLAILSSMKVFSDNGSAALAYWQDEQSLHMAIIEAGQPCPDYRIKSTKDCDKRRLDALYLVHSKNRECIHDESSALLLKTTEQSAARHMAGSEMSEYRRNRLLNGIEIDSSLRQALIASAERVLVESTEQSRRGAGE